MLGRIGALDQTVETCESLCESVFHTDRLGIVVDSKRISENELWKEVMSEMKLSGWNEDELFEQLLTFTSSWYIPLKTLYLIFWLTNDVLKQSNLPLIWLFYTHFGKQVQTYLESHCSHTAISIKVWRHLYLSTLLRWSSTNSSLTSFTPHTSNFCLTTANLTITIRSHESKDSLSSNCDHMHG